MKPCRSCEQELSLDQFASKSAMCRDCHRAYMRDHYRRNQQYYAEKNKGKSAAYVSSHRQRVKARLVEAHGGSCRDCGFSGPPFMFDFDHRNPAEKSFAIGNIGLNIAYERLLAETQKCDLVCANCHRMRTHRQRCGGCDHC